MSDSATITVPDISARPFHTSAERFIPLPANVLFDAWTTENFGRWFAAPGTVIMQPQVNSLFFLNPILTTAATLTTAAFSSWSRTVWSK